MVPYNPECHSTVTCYDRDHSFMLSGFQPQSTVCTEGAGSVDVVSVNGRLPLMGNAVILPEFALI